VWIGDGLEALIARAIAHSSAAQPRQARNGPGERVHAAALEAFLACYRQNLFTRSRLYPDVEATLDALLGRGIRLCCITNKRHAFSETLLEQAGIRGRLRARARRR
jgi:phosphoglycolate phosphatase